MEDTTKTMLLPNRMRVRRGKGVPVDVDGEALIEVYELGLGLIDDGVNVEYPVLFTVTEGENGEKEIKNLSPFYGEDEPADYFELIGEEPREGFMYLQVVG